MDVNNELINISDNNIINIFNINNEIINMSDNIQEINKDNELMIKTNDELINDNENINLNESEIINLTNSDILKLNNEYYDNNKTTSDKIIRSPSFYKSTDKYKIKKEELKPLQTNISEFTIKVDDIQPELKTPLTIKDMSDIEFDTWVRNWNEFYNENIRSEFVELLTEKITNLILSMNVYNIKKINHNKHIIFFAEDLIMILAEFFGSGEISNKITISIIEPQEAKTIPIPMIKKKEEPTNKAVKCKLENIKIGRCDLHQLQSGTIKNTLQDRYHICLDYCFITKKFKEESEIIKTK